MRASEFIKEAKLGNVLPWPEVVNKVNSAMKAMGWKGQRKDDGSLTRYTSDHRSQRERTNERCPGWIWFKRTND